MASQRLDRRVRPSQNTKPWIVTIKFISVWTTGTHATSGAINEFDGEFFARKAVNTKKEEFHLCMTY